MYEQRKRFVFVASEQGCEISKLVALLSKISEALTVWQFELSGFAPVPRIQIVTIEQAMALRDRAVRLPARGDGGFKRAAREEDVRSQGALDL